MPQHSFIVNGERVTVDAPDDLRLLWALRDLLGIHGPKYGCGLEVCKSCTSHINGKAFNPCAVPVSKIKPTDEITTIALEPAGDPIRLPLEGPLHSKIDVGVRFEQLRQLAPFIDPLAQSVIGLEPALQRFDLRDGLPGALGIGPERSVGHRALQLHQARRLAVNVKETP